MKKIIMSMAFMAMGFFMQAQIMIDGEALNLDGLQYIEVEFLNIVGSNDLKVFIDYGQKVTLLDRKSRTLTNKQGRAILFRSKVHALNWFYLQGWDILEVYHPTSGGQTSNNDILYLLKKIE